VGTKKEEEGGGEMGAFEQQKKERGSIFVVFLLGRRDKFFTGII